MQWFYESLFKYFYLLCVRAVPFMGAFMVLHWLTFVYVYISMRIQSVEQIIMMYTVVMRSKEQGLLFCRCKMIRIMNICFSTFRVLVYDPISVLYLYFTFFCSFLLFGNCFCLVVFFLFHFVLGWQSSKPLYLTRLILL